MWWNGMPTFAEAGQSPNADIAATARSLTAFGVSTIHEALGRRGLLRDVHLLVGPAFAGPAATVLMPAGDNLGLHALLRGAAPGAVLCVASGGQGTFGVFGDLLLTAAVARRVAGLVIDDGIRDLAELSGPPSVAARGISARGTQKRRVLSLDEAVALGGVLIRPGDWIVADADGVCVVPADRLEALLAAAAARVGKEAGIRQALQSGRTSVEVLGLSPLLDGKDHRP